MRIRPIAAVAVALLPAQPATAQDFGPKDAQATPPGVHWVQAGGHWQRGGQRDNRTVTVRPDGYSIR